MSYPSNIPISLATDKTPCLLLTKSTWFVQIFPTLLRGSSQSPVRKCQYISQNSNKEVNNFNLLLYFHFCYHVMLLDYFFSLFSLHPVRRKFSGKRRKFSGRSVSIWSENLSSNVSWYIKLIIFQIEWYIVVQAHGIIFLSNKSKTRKLLYVI